MQVDLRLCWSLRPHCLISHVAAHMVNKAKKNSYEIAHILHSDSLLSKCDINGLESH